MKKLLPLLLLILIGCSKNGVYETYYKGSNQLKKVETYTDNILNGPYKSYHDNGKLKEERMYSSGNITSSTEYFYKEYDNVDGKRINGKWVGPYKTYSYYENGQLESEKTYKDYINDGPYKSYYEDGQLKEEGTYKNGSKLGSYVFYFQDGGYEKGTYKNGKEDGPYVLYDSNGKLEQEGTYMNGVWNGPYKYYNKNGGLTEGTYKNGKLDGPFKSYHSNGKILHEGTYKNSQLDGLYKIYRESGKLKDKIIYDNGEIISVVSNEYGLPCDDIDLLRDLIFKELKEKYNERLIDFEMTNFEKLGWNYSYTTTHRLNPNKKTTRYGFTTCF